MAVETSISATEIAIALNGTRHGNGWRCESPCCSGRRKAFSVKDAGGRPIFHCFRCNDQDASLAGLRARGLWAAPSPRAQARHRLGAILRSLRHEASIIVVGINDLLAYRPIEAVDLARVETALRRLDAEQRELGTYRRRGRHRSILDAVDQEVDVVRAAGLRLVSRDAPFTDAAFTRTCDAAGRITAASEVCHE